ncbi:MAG: dihydrodipicolinate synthase family protein [Geminicoccaceae bacterium]|jgi:4-hydroxy-tetrahydrodipicolinate synthase|nr:dihydrodipicolinate synthase family protein [Geminicoccaceae bacterium]MCB9968327.1 dihydrodipicolinate synthase family protein [Geminicoccaceae bacterium]
MSAGEAVGGIYPIVYAFFDGRGRIDRALMQRQVEVCIKGGAHGLACLGIATEVGKLRPEERQEVLELVATTLAGRVPLAVTVFGRTVEEQAAFVREAAAAGAGWVILQPPVIPDIDEAALLRFFGRVADASPVPVAIQNAPAYLGVGLSPEGLATLNRQHPNVTLLKGETSAVEIEAMVRTTAGRYRVLNGRGGLEFTDNIRAGCVGMIPAPDCFDVQVRILEAMRDGREAEAETLYREILPAITFVMQSIASLLCYGKRLVAARLGLDPATVVDRDPAMLPSDFGLAITRRLAAGLGPYPSD